MEALIQKNGFRNIIAEISPLSWGSYYLFILEIQVKYFYLYRCELELICHFSKTILLLYAISQYLKMQISLYIGHDVTKPVFGISDQVRPKPTSSVDCADDQAGLLLCCSHATKSGFVRSRPMSTRDSFHLCLLTLSRLPYGFC